MSDQEHENDPSAVLASQSTQNDPAETLRRENASLRDQLQALQNSNVVRGAFSGEAPRYTLNDPGFYDDTFFPAGSVIDYIDAPNLSMAPMNEPARRAMAEHIAILEHGARAKAHMAGREYFGQVNDRNVSLDLAHMDARKHAAEVPVPVVQMPTIRGEVPAMPHTDDAIAAQRRGPGRPRKVVSSTLPESTSKRDLGAPTLPPAIVGRMVG